MSPKCKEHKKGERQAVHMHYLPFGTRLNKGILMVTQLTLGFMLFNFRFDSKMIANHKTTLF